jgi:hypothetical protein
MLIVEQRTNHFWPAIFATASMLTSVTAKTALLSCYVLGEIDDSKYLIEVPVAEWCLV